MTQVRTTGLWALRPKRRCGPFSSNGGFPVSDTIDDATRRALLDASILSEAVQEAQTPRAVPQDRPEQQPSEHDRSDLSQATRAQPSSTSFANQPDQGEVLSFEFYRNPLNAKRPTQTFDEIMQADVQAKPCIMAAQQQLLERRYDLTPRFDRDHRMSWGKPIAAGPTARLQAGMDWDTLARMTSEAFRQANAFPYPSLPHPKQATGGQVFPQMQLLMFPGRSASTSPSTCRRPSYLNFLRSSSCKTAQSWVMSHVARSSRSVISTACSKTGSPWSSSTACACC